jgi:EmrB/QacA subfamily drug resistance transporter
VRVGTTRAERTATVAVHQTSIRAKSQVNPWAVLTVLMLGTFMSLLDLTIVNIAIPSILDGLHASLDQILWVLNAYSLLFAVLLITSGRLGDIFGPRNLFALGVFVFTLGSAGSGLAQSATWLIAARATQGLGAALMSPQALPFITSLFPAERRGGPFAALGMLSGIAVLAGPTLGGFIVTHIGWQWIFFLNIPIGLMTLAGALFVIPDLRLGRRHRLDLTGVLLVTVGLLAIVFGLIEGQRYNWGVVWGAVTIPEVIGAGMLVLVIFLLSQALRQRHEPLVPFVVFRDRNFTLMAGVLAVMGFAMLGLFLPLTIYYQSVLGLSALAAGLTIAPQPLAMMFTSPIAAGLSQRVNGKYLLLPGLLFFAAGMGYIDWMAHADASRWSFLPGLIAGGVGLGFIWVPVYSLATRDLRPELAGVASGLLSTIQELGGVIASAAIGALLQNRLATSLHAEAVQSAAQLPPAAQGPFVAAFNSAAKSGLEVGQGQTGASPQSPAGLPAEIVAQVQHLAAAVFTHAYVDAMRPTLLLPIALMLVAALATLAVRTGTSTRVERTATQVSAERQTVA